MFASGLSASTQPFGMSARVPLRQASSTGTLTNVRTWEALNDS